MSIEDYGVNWDTITWTSPMPGVRFKAFVRDGKRLRLVEFSKGFVEPDWCLKGHIGYVLEGNGELEFSGGRVASGPGTGIFIPPGPEHKHKLHVLSDVIRVVLVEEA